MKHTVPDTLVLAAEASSSSLPRAICMLQRGAVPPLRHAMPTNSLLRHPASSTLFMYKTSYTHSYFAKIDRRYWVWLRVESSLENLSCLKRHTHTTLSHRLEDRDQFATILAIRHRPSDYFETGAKGNMLRYFFDVEVANPGISCLFWTG